MRKFEVYGGGFRFEILLNCKCNGHLIHVKNISDVPEICGICNSPTNVERQKT